MPSIFHLAWVATQPVIKTALLCAVGAWATRKGLLTAEGRRVLSAAAFYVFSPALTFTNLTPLLNIYRLLNWWPFVFNIMVAIGLGLGLGYAVLPVAQPEPWFKNHVVVCTALGNSMSLPLVLVTALTDSTSGLLHDMPQEEAAALAIAYISMGLLMATLVHTTVGFNMLKPTRAASDSSDSPRAVALAVWTGPEGTDANNAPLSGGEEDPEGEQGDLQERLRRIRQQHASTYNDDDDDDSWSPGKGSTPIPQPGEAEDVPLLAPSLPQAPAPASTPTDRGNAETTPLLRAQGEMSSRGMTLLPVSVSHAEADHQASVQDRLVPTECEGHHQGLAAGGGAVSDMKNRGYEASMLMATRNVDKVEEVQELECVLPGNNNNDNVSGSTTGGTIGGVGIGAVCVDGGDAVATVTTSEVGHQYTHDGLPPSSNSLVTQPVHTPVSGPYTGIAISRDLLNAVESPQSNLTASTTIPTLQPSMTVCVHTTLDRAQTTPDTAEQRATVQPSSGEPDTPSQPRVGWLQLRVVSEGEDPGKGDPRKREEEAAEAPDSAFGRYAPQRSFSRALSWGARMLSFKRQTSVRGPHEPWHAHLTATQMKGTPGRRNDDQHPELHDGIAWAPFVEHPGLDTPRGGTTPRGLGHGSTSLRRRLLSVSSSMSRSMSRMAARSFSRLDTLGRNVTGASRKLMRRNSVRLTVKVGSVVFREATSPPILACLLAILIGCITPLKNLMFPVGAPFKIVTEVLQTLSQCCVPSLMLVLGATLAYGPGTTQVSWQTMISVTVCRLVILPIVGLLAILGTVSAGWIHPTEPVFFMVLLMAHVVPTAVNVQTMASVHQNGDKEIAAMLFWQYLVSIFTLPPYLTLILYIVSRHDFS